MSRMLKIIRYWLPVFSVVGIIAYCSSLTPDELPQFDFPHIDKLKHIIAYGVLGFFIARALSEVWRYEPVRAPWLRIILTTMLYGSLYGAIDEWHQSFTPGRVVEFGDIVADFIGSLLGAWLVRPYRFWLARKVNPTSQ